MYAIVPTASPVVVSDSPSWDVELAHAEIEDARALALVRERLDEDVARLEVAMNDTRGVRVDEPVKHVLPDARSLVPLQQPAAPPHVRRERLAVEQLHHQEELSRRGARSMSS